MIGEGCFLDANTAEGRIELQDDVWLSRGSYIVAGRAQVIVGPTTYIGHRCLFYGHNGIQIGRDVLLANDVQLICGNHTFSRRDIPIRAQPPLGAPIVVEDDVWLGASVIVLGGVTSARARWSAPAPSSPTACHPTASPAACRPSSSARGARTRASDLHILFRCQRDR